jgi:hypothetical protein
MSRNWLLLTLIAAGTLYLLAVDPMLDLNGDSPRFVMLARSLQSGNGYTEHFAPNDYPETQIPYLYPLMLMPIVALDGPEAYGAFKVVSVLCALLALCSMWFWMSQWTGREDARWIVIVAAFLVEMQKLGTSIATEAPFLAASFACAGFIERATRKESGRRDWVLATLFLGISFHLRAAGWSLLATLCIVLLLRKGVRAALAGAAAGLLVCSPWLLRVIRFGFAYSDEFQQNTGGMFAFFYRFVYNAAADVAKALPDLFLSPVFQRYIPFEPWFFVKAGVGALVGCLMAWGCWRFFGSRREEVTRPTSIYFVIYLVGALSWTVHGDRYLLPILPVLLWLLLAGSGKLKPYTIAILLAVGVTGCVWTAYLARTGYRSPEEAGFIAAANWIRQNAAGTDRVMSRYPTWIGTYTGNRGIRWEEVADSKVHLKTIVDSRIDWVIVDRNKVFRESAADRLLPLMLSDSEEFELRYTTPTEPPAFVYRFRPRH